MRHAPSVRGIIQRGIVFDKDMNPDRPGQSEKINKGYGSYDQNDDQYFVEFYSKSKSHDQPNHEKQPRRDSVGDKHSAIIKTGFRIEILLAMGTMGRH